MCGGGRGLSKIHYKPKCNQVTPLCKIKEGKISSFHLNYLLSVNPINGAMVKQKCI